MTETVVVSIRPFLAVGISLLAAFLIMLSDKAKPNVREAWTLLAAFGKFACMNIRFLISLRVSVLL